MRDLKIKDTRITEQLLESAFGNFGELHLATSLGHLLAEEKWTSEEVHTLRLFLVKKQNTVLTGNLKMQLQILSRFLFAYEITLQYKETQDSEYLEFLEPEGM